MLRHRSKAKQAEEAQQSSTLAAAFAFDWPSGRRSRVDPNDPVDAWASPTLRLVTLRYSHAEDCVSGNGSGPCIAAPLYEWAWAAIAVSVLALSIYTQYKSRKLCHIADRLGVPVGDAFVMLRPDRRANLARTRRGQVGMVVATLLGAVATGLCIL